MSFVNKVIKSSSDNIFFITCKDIAGVESFYFVLSTHEKIKRLELLTEPSFNISDYGKIIISGYGKTPPEEIQKKMRDEYGFSMK